MRGRRPGLGRPLGGAIATTPSFWIVNADAGVLDRWARLLRRQGWQVQAVPGLVQFGETLSPGSVGLAMIDEACFDSDGAAQLERLKAKAQGISILLTSGAALGNELVIELLEAGADDFFPHSMAPDLLLAKLKAHLRRILPGIAQDMDVLKAPAGDLKLDRAKREVLIRDAGGNWAANTNLTSTELQLLILFLKRPGAALERRFIIDSLWQSEGERIQPGTVDKHVESLRRKLGAVGGRIHSIYGVGYAYREPRPSGARRAARRKGA